MKRLLYIDRGRRMPAISSRFLRSKHFSSSWQHLKDDLAIWYAAIYEQSGRRVIVDSSKSPMYAALLGDIPTLNVAYIHLERDSRGVVFSWASRPKHLPEYLDEERSIPTISSTRGAIFWSIRYAMSMLIGHNHPSNMLEICYELLARDPAGTLEATEQFIEGLDFPNLGASGIDAEIGRYHSVGGNPIRFDRNVPNVRLDDEWRQRMSWCDRTIVTALTTPFLVRHYRIIRDSKTTTAR